MVCVEVYAFFWMILSQELLRWCWKFLCFLLYSFFWGGSWWGGRTEAVFDLPQLLLCLCYPHPSQPDPKFFSHLWVFQLEDQLCVSVGSDWERGLTIVLTLWNYICIPQYFPSSSPLHSQVSKGKMLLTVCFFHWNVDALKILPKTKTSYCTTSSCPPLSATLSFVSCRRGLRD